MTQRRKKSQLLWIVLVLRIILFLAEIGVGLWSRSLSLLAGSGHIFSDLVTLGLTLLAAYLVKHRTGNKEGFKYQRLEIWVAMLNGLSLIAIACLIFWETVTHLQAPKLEPSLPVLLVAGLSVAINSANIHLLRNDSHQDLNLRGVFLHGIADAASSLSVMLSALVVYCWHWLWADTVASLFVASLIVWSALSLFLKTLTIMRGQTSSSTSQLELFKDKLNSFVLEHER